jgi:hypothetical protein
MKADQGWFDDGGYAECSKSLRGNWGFPKNAKERGTHCVGNVRKIKSLGHPAMT